MSVFPWHEDVPDKVLECLDGCYKMYGGIWYSPSEINDLREKGAIRSALSEMSDDMHSRYIDTVRGIDCRLYSVLKRNGKV